MEKIITKIEDKTVVAGVIRLGCVGLPMAVTVARKADNLVRM